MNNFTKQNEPKNLITFFLMFVFILLFNISAFSQTSENSTVISSISDVTINDEVKAVNNKADANIEFVLWFMGSKQNPNTTISTDGIHTKKEIMTSGIAPNRILIKAFLKKAVNYETSIA